jgi:hypothetical protein
MKTQLDLFGNQPDDTPLFSGTPIRATLSEFTPKDPEPKQMFMLTNCEKCKDTQQVKVKNKMLPCPYC